MEKVDRAPDFIRRRADMNSPIEIELLFRRVTVVFARCAISVSSSEPSQIDVVSMSLFGHSFDLIDSYDEFTAQLKLLASFGGGSKIFKHFPLLKPISLVLPIFMDSSVLKGMTVFDVMLEPSVDKVLIVVSFPCSWHR